MRKYNINDTIPIELFIHTYWFDFVIFRHDHRRFRFGSCIHEKGRKSNFHDASRILHKTQSLSNGQYEIYQEWRKKGRRHTKTTEMLARCSRKSCKRNLFKIWGKKLKKLNEKKDSNWFQLTTVILNVQIELEDWEPADLSPEANNAIIRHVIKKPKTWGLLPIDGSTVTG